MTSNLLCLRRGLALLALSMLSTAVFAADPPKPEFQVLGKTLWVVITKPVEGAHADEGAMRAHMEHQFRLEREGIMFGAGPLSTADGGRYGGMIVIRAASKEDAVRIADSDPMHARGLRSYTLYKWTLNEGHLGLSLDFSTGKFTLE